MQDRAIICLDDLYLELRDLLARLRAACRMFVVNRSLNLRTGGR